MQNCRNINNLNKTSTEKQVELKDELTKLRQEALANKSAAMPSLGHGKYPKGTTWTVTYSNRPGDRFSIWGGDARPRTAPERKP